MAKMKRFIDIGANLTDAMYSGIYCGRKKHEPDLSQVLKRSWENGLEKLIVTGGSLEESIKALDLAESDERLFATVGCHPTRCLEFEKGDPVDYLEALKKLAVENASKVVAIGECGLDYDRLEFCPKDVQRKYFEMQLDISKHLELPLFLHCRNAASDLLEILTHHDGLRGVVHSFDGTIAEAESFIGLGYFIGLNGCSLKTKENLETVAQLPSDRILLETDSPWCEIRPSHAGFSFVSKANQLASVKREKWKPDLMVKCRNEPANIRQVLDVVAAVRNEDPYELADKVYDNTINAFFKSTNRTPPI